MKNTKPVVDTNILVYAHNIDSPFFSSARGLLEELIAHGGFVVTSLILLEFFSVITNGRKIERPLSPKDALAVIEDLTESVCAAILEPVNTQTFEEWLRDYVHSIKRYQIYDAHIAFSMQQNGLSKIFTLNTNDFKKFDFIDAVNPFVPAAMREPAHPMRFIPYGRQSIDEKDVAAVCSVLRSDWLTTGPKVAEFEEAFAQFVDAKYAVAVSSGTAALHAAMYALGIGPGDDVIVPPMTFAATANCVVFQGGTPVFCDVDSDTLLLDPSLIEAKVTTHTKAIIAVDYAGQPCDYDRLREIADQRGLALVADGCHALGAEYKRRNVGSLADMTVFSFHPVKHITTGEGGMITTENPELAERLRLFRNHGITKDFRVREQQGSWHYEMVDLGYNYRITDVQCAVGISQLEKLPGFLSRRREIAGLYEKPFSNVPEINPLAVHGDIFHAYHLFVVKIDFASLGIGRSEFFRRMRERGIGVNVHYIPVHMHPFYRRRFGTGHGLCPVAENAYEQIISLPIFPAMSDADVRRVGTALLEMLESIKEMRN